MWELSRELLHLHPRYTSRDIQLLTANRRLMDLCRYTRVLGKEKTFAKEYTSEECLNCFLCRKNFFHPGLSEEHL